MDKYMLGIDIGTTSVKVVLLEIRSKELSESFSFPTNADIIGNESKVHEQSTGEIIRTLNKCMTSLSKHKLKNVSGIGVSGQMHGVLLWNSKTGCEWTDDNLFLTRDSSQLITWKDGRCSSNFLSILPNPDSHLSLATGFGCATILWYARNRPEFLDNFKVAGTIQDYVVSMLCGLGNCVMTPQNATSWGYFNTNNNQWNMEILKDAGFPVHLLPECVESGSMAGLTCSDWFDIPPNTPVGAALGDFQCSVYSCMTDRTDAVLNIGTSAQLTYAMPENFKPPNVPEPTSSISHFPYFESSYLAVAASLNGGNVLATFVRMLSLWMKELGSDVSDSILYEKLIQCGISQRSSDLRVCPTVLGERHDPLCMGQVSNITSSNLSLGHITRALCCGVLDNIAAMMPPDSLNEAGVKRIIGSGSALSQNKVLREEAERAFPLPVEYGHDVDAAVGVAMVFCNRL